MVDSAVILRETSSFDFSHIIREAGGWCAKFSQPVLVRNARKKLNPPLSRTYASARSDEKISPKILI